MNDEGMDREGDVWKAGVREWEQEKEANAKIR